MGAHLLSLSELSPALLHLTSSSCVAYLGRTHFGRSILPRLRALSDEIERALDEKSGGGPSLEDELGDLSRYPGYAEMAVQFRQRAQRQAGVLLWSRVDPLPMEPAPCAPPSDRDGESPERRALRVRAVSLLTDLRQGLRLESTYRQGLPADLDTTLFAPLDGAIRRRQDRTRRAERRSTGAPDARPIRAHIRRDEPSVGAGPLGY